MFHKQFYVNLTPLEWAQVLYYAHKYNRDRREIVRGMLTRYIEADKRYDTDEFLSFVKSELKQSFTDEDDDMFREQVRAQAEEHVASRSRVLDSSKDQGRVSRSSRSKR